MARAQRLFHDSEASALPEPNVTLPSSQPTEINETIANPPVNSVVSLLGEISTGRDNTDEPPLKESQDRAQGLLLDHGRADSVELASGLPSALPTAPSVAPVTDEGTPKFDPPSLAALTFSFPTDQTSLNDPSLSTATPQLAENLSADLATSPEALLQPGTKRTNSSTPRVCDKISDADFQDPVLLQTLEKYGGFASSAKQLPVLSPPPARAPKPHIVDPNPATDPPKRLTDDRNDADFQDPALLQALQQFGGFSTVKDPMVCPAPNRPVRLSLTQMRETCLRCADILRPQWPAFAERFLRLRYQDILHYDYADSLDPHHPLGGTFSADTDGRIEALRTALIQRGCVATHVSVAWVAHHYRLVVWKLASLARYFTWLMFPERPDLGVNSVPYRPCPTLVYRRNAAHAMCPEDRPVDVEHTRLLEVVRRWGTLDEVIIQLHFRHRWEYGEGHRSALRRVYERDDPPQRYMALVVVTGGSESPETDVDSAGQAQSGPKATVPPPPPWVLSDGWYTIPVQPDPVLRAAWGRGRIRVGTKLATIGARLVGPQDGYAPLEAPDSIQLVLSANSTRRAPFDMPLGFHRRHLVISLASIDPDGSQIAQTDVVLLRKFQVNYLETLPDGTTAVRTEPEEEKAAKAFEAARLQLQQRKAGELEADKQAAARAVSGPGRPLAQLETGEDIHNALLVAGDVAAAELTLVQRDALEAYLLAQRDTQCQLLADAVRVDLPERRVRPFFRVVVQDICGIRGRPPAQATITLWGHDTTHHAQLREHYRYRFTQLQPSRKPPRVGMLGVELHLTSTRGTVWREQSGPHCDGGTDAQADQVRSPGDRIVRAPPRSAAEPGGLAWLPPPPYAFLTPSTKPAPVTIARDSAAPPSLLASPQQPVRTGVDATLETCRTLTAGTVVNLVGIVVRTLPHPPRLTVKEPQLVLSDGSTVVGVIQHRRPVNPRFEARVDAVVGLVGLTLQGLDASGQVCVLTFDRGSTYVYHWDTPAYQARYRLVDHWRRRNLRALRMVQAATADLPPALLPAAGYHPPGTISTNGMATVATPAPPVRPAVPTRTLRRAHLIEVGPVVDLTKGLAAATIIVAVDDGCTVHRLRIETDRFRQLLMRLPSPGPAPLADPALACGLLRLRSLLRPGRLGRPLPPDLFTDQPSDPTAEWYAAWNRVRDQRVAECLRRQTGLKSANYMRLTLGDLWLLMSCSALASATAVLAAPALMTGIPARLRVVQSPLISPNSHNTLDGSALEVQVAACYDQLAAALHEHPATGPRMALDAYRQTYVLLPLERLFLQEEFNQAFRHLALDVSYLGDHFGFLSP
ncbi:Breast cancer 2, early onset [Tieghemiomyces parasiticus]|uniref:Breast cancer 2, early onset n=1 Tax=Tieghemiomyces parasiticus TaxID=78921 RepID=A0A9W8AGW4_9FUNG|nr:Breast cancer 2, early onset [Tieghemiomyces parasiticus]